MNKQKAKILLHSCCAPCLTGSYIQIVDDYEVIPLWYNPNILPEEELDKRLESYRKLLNIYGFSGDEIANSIINSDVDNWRKEVSGLENEIEGGKRCEKCIRFRLDKCGQVAKERGIKFFATTLSISPYKNLEMINNIGKEIADIYGLKFLDFDFKQNQGFENSIQLSKEYGLYRQRYCGCAPR